MNPVARSALAASSILALVTGFALPLSAAGIPVVDLRQPTLHSPLAHDGARIGEMAIALRTKHI